MSSLGSSKDGGSERRSERTVVSTRLEDKPLRRLANLLVRIRKRIGIEVSRSSLLERVIERGLESLEAEENRASGSRRVPIQAKVALSPSMLQIRRLPGVRFTVERPEDLPRRPDLGALLGTTDEGVRAAARRHWPREGDYARVLSDDGIYVHDMAALRGLKQWRKVDPVGSLEWAVFLVNVPGGAVAPIGLWPEYWPPVSAASGPFWNGPFVIATCSSSVAAQAVVDALLDAARMFDPRPDSPLTKDPQP